MIRLLLPLLAACLMSADALAAPAAAPEANPAYVRMNNSWMGYWPHGQEHLQFQVIGEQSLRQDAWHFTLRPGLDMMLSFVAKDSFLPARSKGKTDLLKAHMKWQEASLRKEFGKVQSKERKDLAERRGDVSVTEFIVRGKKRPRLRVYMIGLATHDGVYMFAISPVEKPEDDAFARSLAASLNLLHRPMDPTTSAPDRP